jgi:hypothetical protein
VVKLVTKNRGREALLVLATIFTILMMGTLPAVRGSNFSGNAYTAEFWRSSPACPIDLGSWIQARFTSDAGTLVIKETGTQAKLYSNNNGTGDFIFGENTQGYYYDGNALTFQYPGVDAEADFRHYELFGVNLTVTAPVSGTNDLTLRFPRMNYTTSYSANFSSAADQLQILITQNGPPTSTIVATYTIISPSGTTLDTVTQTWTFPSQYTNPPPYANYGVSDLLHGLEKFGYAHVLSGTDFQIESVIHPSTATDFTGYEALQYDGSQSQFTIPPSGGPCFSSYPEDEGTDEVLPSTSTTGTVQSSNEAYQYVKVT